MKVGILTMSYKRNYGGILQAYALYKVITRIGHDVELINFNCDYNQNIPFFVKFMNKIVRLAKSHSNQVSTIKTRSLPKEHIKIFSEFKKCYLPYSEEVNNNTISKYISKYDALIVGSDQVWNNINTKKLYFFYDFSPKYNGIKIAYAPCSIYKTVPWFNKRKIRRLINDFKAVSVRDNTTQNMIMSACGYAPQIVLDPTQLYDFTEFAEQKPLIDGKYIFTYILGSEITCGHQFVLELIKQKYGDMPIVAAIIPNISLEVEKFSNRIMYNASPADWVNLIANSSFVYTDSFHGCVFSMKYHKQFFAYYKDSRRASRLIDMRNTYGLNNIYGPSDSIELRDIDYTLFDKTIESQKRYSMDFLENNII